MEEGSLMASEFDENEDYIEEEEYYFNGFGIGISKTDVLIYLTRNGKREIVLNASHITAKSLAIALTKAMDDFEIKINSKILLSEDIEKLLDS